MTTTAATDVKTAEEILGMWADLRIEVETIDRDMYKSLVKGNTAAGRRSRAKFRALKKAAADIVREMVKLDKDRAAKKKAAKAGK
ncbi:MAG: hypothetical protein WC761_00420 [Candidatus Paceibacterota bacterium]|jgi:hypothetical protein